MQYSFYWSSFKYIYTYIHISLFPLLFSYRSLCNKKYSELKIYILFDFKWTLFVCGISSEWPCVIMEQDCNWSMLLYRDLCVQTNRRFLYLFLTWITSKVKCRRKTLSSFLALCFRVLSKNFAWSNSSVSRIVFWWERCYLCWFLFTTNNCRIVHRFSW